MESRGTRKLIGFNYFLKMLPQPYECSLSAKLLSPTLFWFLCSTLPACYLKLENKFKSMESEPEVRPCLQFCCCKSFSAVLTYDLNFVTD